MPLIVFGTISLSLYAAFWAASLLGRACVGAKSVFGRRNKDKAMQKIAV